MKKRIAGLIIAGGVLALAVAGCGSGGQALGLESNLATPTMQSSLNQAAAIKPADQASAPTSSGTSLTSSR